MLHDCVGLFLITYCMIGVLDITVPSIVAVLAEAIAETENVLTANAIIVTIFFILLPLVVDS